jgi:hypothetical protein
MPPRVSDFVEGILSDVHDSGELSEDMLVTLVWLFGIDISDAFHQFPLNNKDKSFTVAFIDNKFWVFNCLVFGSGSAPTAWRRFAAFLGRPTAAMADERFHLQMYVDDPAFSCRGTINEAATQFLIALLWATALGYPLAWRKADGGRAIFWIGAAITAHPTNVEISFPHDACEELATETSTAFNETIITTRELRSLAGSLNFVAGIVHPLRSFLAPLLAALSSRKPNEWSLSHRARHRDRLPKGLIEVQQCKHALGWIMAFLKKQRGAISRVANYARRSTPRPPTPTNQIQVASPQGHHRISLTTPCLRRNDATHSHTRSSASTFQSYPLTSVRASRCSIISRSTMQPTRPPQWMPQESDAGPLPSPESQTRCPTSTQQASPQVRKSCRAITSASPAKPRSSSNGVNKQDSINDPA